jgi:hypothetical protein
MMHMVKIFGNSVKMSTSDAKAGKVEGSRFWLHLAYAICQGFFAQSKAS